MMVFPLRLSPGAVQPETVAHRLDAKDAAAMEDEEE